MDFKRLKFEQAGEITKIIRRRTCNECPHIKATFKVWLITILNRKQCGECKCDILKKTSLKLEKCPIGKW